MEGEGTGWYSYMTDLTGMQVYSSTKYKGMIVFPIGWPVGSDGKDVIIRASPMIGGYPSGVGETAQAQSGRPISKNPFLADGWTRDDQDTYSKTVLVTDLELEE